MSKTVDLETVVKIFNHQVKSTEMWVEQWRRYRDMGSVRNAALSIGRLAGIYQVMLNMKDSDQDIPEEVGETMAAYWNIWDSLDVSDDWKNPARI